MNTLKLYIVYILVLIGVNFTSIPAHASPNYVTFQSRIIKPDGSPLEHNAVNFRMSITDTVGSCVIFQEDFIGRNMSGSKGLVNLSLGAGSKVYPVGAMSMTDVFNNYNSPSFVCQAGGNINAGTNDRRKLIVQFNDGSGWQTVPAMDINSTPFSLQAMAAQKLGDYPAADYLRTTTLPTCGAGQALNFNGTSITCIAAGGTGTVMNVTSANADINVATGTTTPALTLNSGTGANQIVKLNGASELPAVSGVNLTTLNATNLGSGTVPAARMPALTGDVTTVAGAVASTIATSAVTSGKILDDTIVDADINSAAAIARSKLAAGTVGQVLMNDATTGLPISLGCATGEVIKFNGSGVAICGTDNGSPGAFVDGGNTFAATATIGTNSNDNLEFKTNGTTKMTVLTNGNVGVGTTTPTGKLEVVQSVAAAAGTIYGFRLFSNNTVSGGSSADNVGIFSEADNSGGASGGTGTLRGMDGVGLHINTGSTQSKVQGVRGTAFSVGPSSVITDARGVYGTVGTANANANLIISGYGGYFDTSGAGANSLTNGYGVYTGTISGSTNKWSIYTSDATAPSYFAGNVGIGTTIPATKLDVAGGIRIGTEAAACAAALAGSLRYNAGSVEYCNGTSWQAFGISGAGLTSLGGQTGSTQTFAIGATGSAPAFSSATNIHTLNIPLASGAGVTSGTISKTDYDNFNNKIAPTSGTSGGIPYFNSASTMASSAVLTAMGVVLGGGAGSSPTSTVAGNANEVLRVPNGGGNPSFGLVDLASSMSGVLPVANGGTNSSTALTNGKVMVSSAGTIIEGNASNTAKSNNTFVMRDGSGNIAGALGTYDQMALNGALAGAVNILAPASVTTWTMTLPTTAGTSGQVLSTNGTGVTSWVTALTAATGFINGGNSFGAAATIGTSDAFDLAIKTNNTTKMTVLAGGNVGIGTTIPNSILEVQAGNALTATTNIPRIRVSSSTNGGTVGAGIAFAVDGNGAAAGNVTAKIVGIRQSNNGLGDLAFFTNSAGPSSGDGSVERMRIDKNGNVGMGTTAPVEKLEVSGGVRAGQAPATLTTLSVAATAVDTALTVVSTTSYPTSGTLLLDSEAMTYTGTTGTTFTGVTRGALGTTAATHALSATVNNYLTTFLATATTPKMVVTGNGNVGVGTTTPVEKFEVTGNERIGQAPSALTTVNGAHTSAATTITVASTTGYPSAGTLLINGEAMTYTGTTATTFTGVTRGVLGTAAVALSNAQSVNNYLSTIQATATTPRMVVTGSGNIGIGTTTPANLLSVNGNTNVSGTFGIGISTAPSYGFEAKTNSMFFYTTAGTPYFYASNGKISIGSSGSPANSLHVQGGTSIGSGAYNILAPSNGLIVEGNVGIGTTTPQTTLQVEGVISPATNNTYTLGNATYRFTEVYATNGVINTSDRREKKDIYNTDLGLDFINKLRPVSYRWNTGVDNDVHYGLIAQEAEQAIAEVGKTEKTSIVTHDEATDRYGVRYSELISPLIKTAQELYSRLMGVEAHQSTQDREIASVKADNAQLKANDDAKGKEIEKLKQENAAMKAYLCAKDPNAAICK